MDGYSTWAVNFVFATKEYNPSKINTLMSCGGDPTNHQLIYLRESKSIDYWNGGVGIDGNGGHMHTRWPDSGSTHYWYTETGEGSDSNNWYKTDLTEVNFSMYYYNNEVFGGTNLTEVDFHLNPSANNAIFSLTGFKSLKKISRSIESNFILTLSV